MNTEPTDIPNHDLPSDDLLALIEDAPMSASARLAAETSLANDPALRRLVDELRSQRRELAALGAVRAPAGLIERAMATAEREALLDLAALEASDTEPTAIPVSRLQPRGMGLSGVLAMIGSRRLVMPMAAAAGVAIAVGAVWLTLAPIARSLKLSGATSPIATTNDTDPAASGAGGDQNSAGAAGPGLAGNAGATATDSGKPTPEAATVASGAGAESSDVAASVEPWQARLATMAMEARSERSLFDRAMAAAREGRLMLVVRPRTDDDLVRARERLAMLSTRAPETSASWRWSAVPPMETSLAIAAMTPTSGDQGAVAFASVDPAQMPLSPSASPGLPMLASGSTAMATLAPIEPILVTTPVLPTPMANPLNLPTAPALPQFDSAMYSVQFALSEPSLRSLLRQAAPDGRSGTQVELVILPAALPALTAPGTDAASVLWWTQPESTWGSRVRVGLIVRTN